MTMCKEWCRRCLLEQSQLRARGRPSGGSRTAIAASRGSTGVSTGTSISTGISTGIRISTGRGTRITLTTSVSTSVTIGAGASAPRSSSICTRIFCTSAGSSTCLFISNSASSVSIIASIASTVRHARREPLQDAVLSAGSRPLVFRVARAAARDQVTIGGAHERHRRVHRLPRRLPVNDIVA